ncbi:hypothetical protein VNO77_02715 [Canavalia gladiata]|uniref:Uncharacterized protein n=1 Tax=Canavalia gladiata TaxID=3824 RepID=A0AAN9MU98_CANGL
MTTMSSYVDVHYRPSYALISPVNGGYLGVTTGPRRRDVWSSSTTAPLSEEDQYRAWLSYALLCTWCILMLLASSFPMHSMKAITKTRASLAWSVYNLIKCTLMGPPRTLTQPCISVAAFIGDTPNHPHRYQKTIKRTASSGLHQKQSHALKAWHTSRGSHA